MTAFVAASSSVQVLQLQSELSRINQHAAAAADAQKWLSVVHGACEQIVCRIERALSIVRQALGGEPEPPVDGEPVVQVRVLRDELLALANTTHDDRPVFGGTTGNFAAYTYSGMYIGDRGCVIRGVSDDMMVAVSRCGMDVFGSPGNDDLFEALADVSQALTAGAAESPLRDALRVMSIAVARATDVQGTVEHAQGQVQQAALFASSRAQTLAGELATLVDVRTVSVERVATASATYQLAQLTIARIRRMAVFRFLR